MSGYCSLCGETGGCDCFELGLRGTSYTKLTGDFESQLLQIETLANGIARVVGLLRAAQRIEAQRAATVEQGAVEDESRVGEADAPTPSGTTP